MARADEAVGQGGRSTIRLSVPGTLEFRDLAIRVVAASCRLAERVGGLAPDEYDFGNELVSAFSEAFNNIAIHGYTNQPSGRVELEIELGTRGVTLRIFDYGSSFDMSKIPPPDLGALPESGFGLFIIRSFMDEVSYAAGSPNVLSLSKWYKEPGTASVAGSRFQGRQDGTVS